MNLAAIVLAGVVTTVAIQTQQVPDRAPECLALNMYHEARGQGTAGLFAVSAVVLNRVNDKRFPNSVCEVIYQGPTRESWKTRQHKDLPDSKRQYYPIKNKCQFSWYCDGKKATTCWAKRITVEVIDMSVAQWRERRSPKPKIRVRVPSLIPQHKAHLQTV